MKVTTQRTMNEFSALTDNLRIRYITGIINFDFCFTEILPYYSSRKISVDAAAPLKGGGCRSHTFLLFLVIPSGCHSFDAVFDCVFYLVKVPIPLL